MAPPSSLPQPLHRLSEHHVPVTGTPAASPPPLRLPPIGLPLRISDAMEPAPRPAEADGTPRPPGGEHPGRLPGPEGPDPLASGAVAPGPTAAFELPALPSAVGTARRVLRDLLTAWGVAGPGREDVVLVASELVTNALVHAAGERIVCRVRSTADRVRLEIEDQNRGPARPVQRRSGPDEQKGRGLLLVDALSADWGVTLAPDRPARIVWADLKTTPEPPAGPTPPEPLPRTTPHSSEGTPPHAPADPCP
ncbi:ATP-binding protein [Streptomyces sp. NPDC016566]|uniref:ATP-binding protein n=1 Tax=Streptomyces sp. NPDC016566 TaxID=3364967 RepID=UPI0036F655A7